MRSDFKKSLLTVAIVVVFALCIGFSGSSLIARAGAVGFAVSMVILVANSRKVRLRSRADLDEAYLQFVETMAQALDARDPHTAGHSIRVGAYAYAIAREMGIPVGEAETIRIAAKLHDIGKIGIPDQILQKPGPLTAEEYGLIKLHPQIGRKILEKVEIFGKLLDVVELHHENHDGSGYPYRLAGPRIPVAARIVHAADAFDCMLTNRAYRNAMPLSKAMAELRSNLGTQFDPVAANTLMKLVNEDRLDEMLLESDKGLLIGHKNRDEHFVESLINLRKSQPLPLSQPVPVLTGERLK